VIVQGHLVVELTNVETGASITRNISGPGVFTFGSDGSTTLTAWGQWSFFFFPDQLGPDAPGSLVLNRGRTVLLIDADGFHQTILSRTGTQEDLCAALTPTP
jgi:hypothetical protein